MYRYFFSMLLFPITLGRAGELVATTFAGKELLKNCTAVSVDFDGTVYATETARRKGGEWSEGPRELSFGFNTVAEKRAWLEANPLAKIQGPRDNNRDGKVNAADLVTNGEVIHWLRDTNGDGVADEHAIVSDAFKDKLDGVAGGILARRGKLWVSCFPTLWQLEQTGKRKPLVTGFAVKIGQRGHDLHGLRMGPYGRLYWTLGDRGLHVEQDGKTFSYPYHGAMLRSEPDGSNFEVFAHGLRNPVEIAFDDYGNWISADNDGDMRGELERLVFITEGSDHGWRRNWQFQRRYSPWLEEKLSVPQHPGQAAHITPTIHNLKGGPCGFTYEPGTALNDHWRKAFILCYSPNTRLDALWLKPQGASFALDRTERMPTAGCPSGINFGPDGALYLADWGGGWNRNDRGGVIKVDDPESAGSDLRRETARLLATLPRNPEERVGLLGHPDQRVRLEAQYALAEAQAIKALRATALDTSASQLARIHGIWGLAQAHRGHPLPSVEFLRTLLRDTDPEIRNQAAKACREIPATSLAPGLITCLQDEPRIQMHAAMALGRCGDESHLPRLTGLLARTTDPFVRHGAVLALAELGSPGDLQALSTHPGPAVRIGAVVALRRMRAPEVKAFIKDPDLLVLREVARAIHDDGGIPAALPSLARLDRSSLQDEAIGRRLLNANVRLGDAEAALRLAAFAAQVDHAPALRLEALDCLRTWTRPERFDRVNGRLVHDPQGSIEDAQAATLRLAGLLNDPDKAIQGAMAKLAQSHKVRFDEAIFIGWLKDHEQPQASRIEALRVLARGQQADAAVQLGLDDRDPVVYAEALRLQALSRPRDALLTLEERLGRTRDAGEFQVLYRLLKDWPDNSADPLIKKQLARMASVPVPARFDLHRAAVEHKLTRDPAPGAYLLDGGDVEKGRRIFTEHATAQCIRCHRAESGPGSEFGPDLSRVATRLKPVQLLDSMLNPNAEIAENFQFTTLVTESATLAGNIIEESGDTLVLVDTVAKKHRIKKSAVKSRTQVQASIMPPMTGILTPGELRDVVAYLKTLGG
ncbi:MAG: HEAT repeat domain-containing protein [Verrucomicrobiota bacterium]